MHPIRERPSGSIQTLARAIGLLILISIVAGAFGESYVPSRLIVATDASATARNLAAHPALYRWGFAVYLIEALCDLTLAVLFYVLLRPAGRTIALVSAFFGLASAALYAVAEAFYFAPGLLLGGGDYLAVFTPAQLDALALLSFRFFSRIGGWFLIFYGVGTVLRGYLIVRSNFLPRTIGVLLIIGGLGFAAQTIAIVLAPSLASPLWLMPMAVAGLSLMAWLLVRADDVAARWRLET